MKRIRQPLAPVLAGTVVRLALIILAGIVFGTAARAEDLAPDVSACLKKAGSGLRISAKLKPHVLRGDFDGDGTEDYAVAVTQGGDQGILICRSAGASTPIVLGAGSAFQEMRNLDFTSWSVHSRHRRIARGFEQGRPPVLRGDAILLEWESASAIVYWNGKRFSWYQQGD